MSCRTSDMMGILAAGTNGTDNPSNDYLWIFVWSIALVAMVALLYLAIIRLRRWMSGPEDLTPEGFTLSDLRKLHDKGQLTDQEYERAKSQLVQQSQAAINRMAATDKKNPPREGL